MALMIRMRQQGARNQHTFRIVLTDKRAPRDGKYKEMLGWYRPHQDGEQNFSIDLERVQHWIGVGAQMSDRVTTFVGRVAPQILKEIQMKRDQHLAKKRAQRRQEAQEKAPAPKKGKSASKPAIKRVAKKKSV